MNKTIANNLCSIQPRQTQNKINHVLDDSYLDINDDQPRDLTKTEQLQYIETLICSLIEMAKQSGETFLVHILNMALLETRDRQRALSRTARP